MNHPRGLGSLIFLVLLLFMVAAGRQVFPRERPPAVFIPASEKLLVELGQGAARPGMYQFSDAQGWGGVISLTNLDCVREARANWPPPVTGQRLDFFCNSLNFLDISYSWMPASKRMALAIPLHPQRMNQEDWQALPGIGPRLAARIEEDRQLNGDFGALEELMRVRGIGPKRINDWRSYFSGGVTD